MQGASRQPVNAEEMLAELKRVVDLSTPPPSFRHPLRRWFPSRVPWFGERKLTRKATVVFRRPRTTRRRAGSRLSFERRPRPLPEAGNWLPEGLALAGTAMIGATFALMNRAPDLPKRELAVVATEGPVRPQSGGQTVEPSTQRRPADADSRPTEPSQVRRLGDAARRHTSAGTQQLTSSWRGGRS